MGDQHQEPLIAICVPTHDGRCDVLRELLDGVIEQARELPGLVEICISDNASRDGTEAMLEEISHLCPCPLAYRRQPENVGLARNLMGSVELARARYCWLMGSDDLLAPGALKRACQLLGELPGLAGYVVGAMHVDAEDPTLRSRALPRAFHPAHEGTRLFEGLERIYDECGNAWCALSWSIVEREAWLRATRVQADAILAHPVFPQVVILAAMAAERPHWGSLAEPLVHQRNATTFLFEGGNAWLAARWTKIIGEAAGAWGAVLGRRRGRRWRTRMRRLQQVWGSAADVRATKLYERPTLRAQARLARVCLGAFWPVRDYWREVLPATVMPVWLTRARYAAGDRALPLRRDVEPARLTLSGSLPDRVGAGSVAYLILGVRNAGRRAFLPEGARAVTIGQRWRTASGHELGREELGLNELAAFQQTLAHVVRANRVVVCEIALYAPLEPGSYSLEVAAHQHGHGWLDRTGSSQALAACVDVVDNVGGLDRVGVGPQSNGLGQC